MREIINEFFYIPKYGKIREKVILTRLVTTIAVVIICLVAMSLTAYTYFSKNITSAFNTIKAANFEANVLITITDSNNDPVTVTKEGKIQTATLDVGEYTVLLTKGTSTAKTGFCIITIGNNDYYTQQIGVDVGRNLTDGSASVTFTLKVSSATKIEILSHWGTSSCYGYDEPSGNPIYIESGDKIELTASTVGNDETHYNDGQSDTENNTSTETTAPPSTEKTESSQTTSETTDTSNHTTTTETSSSTEPSSPVNTTEPAETESTSTTASTETKPTE